MKIGIIVDGVLIDTRSFKHKEGINFFQEKYCFLNENAYNFRDMFNCSNDDQKRFYKKNKYYYYKYVSPEVGASKFTYDLKENGNIIYLIANRKNINDKSVMGDIYRLRLNMWLKNNNILYDHIIYCDSNSDDKNELIEKSKLDYVIEDQIRDAIILSKFCKVILYDRPYNIGFNMTDRVNSFGDVFDIINPNYKILKKNKK